MARHKELFKDAEQSIAHKFMSFANSLRHGYVKPWKAYGMIQTFGQMKTDDRDRVLSWVKNCLNMEGFHDSDCEVITDWIMENVNG